MSNNNLNKPMSKQWFWHPKLPVEFYPYFDWPPKLKEIFNFVFLRWLQKSDRTIFLILSFMTFYLLMPTMETMSNLSTNWIFMLILRNIILITIVAGSLHWWFYILMKELSILNRAKNVALGILLKKLKGRL